MRARYLVVGLAGAAYVAATHWLMTRAPASDWNAVVVVGPMLALASVYAARRRMRTFAAAAAIVAVALVVQAWRGDGFAPGTLYLVQHVGIHLLLAFVFGSTLQPGREPLITALARRVHVGRRSHAPMVAYSRKVTASGRSTSGHGLLSVRSTRSPPSTLGRVATATPPRCCPFVGSTCSLPAASRVRARDARAGDHAIRSVAPAAPSRARSAPVPHA